MPLTKEKIKDIVVTSGIINAPDFDKLSDRAFKSKTDIETLLVKENFTTDEKLGMLIADKFDIPFKDLREENLQNDLLEMLPEVVARAQGAVIFNKNETGYDLAVTNPENYEFIKQIDKATDGKITTYYATPFGLAEALKAYKNNIFKNVADLIEDYKVNNNDNSIVVLVNQLLEYAYDNGASDIHVEPLSDGMVAVRYRIDGILNEVVRYPIEMHNKLVFRIKIMSHLRTDEQDATQDGRFEYQKEKISFDVRVSILPVTTGENVVMRILSERTRKIVLEDLGLNQVDFLRVQKAMAKPYGMVLVVGPTGAGKTTTLYAVVQILARLPINIVTIEDPVEYSIDRVQQIQVNAKKNITFANGLKSIVRQDPDVIMVGEIRDNETASIAVNAAMTGHLLLSTLHSNDAATIFPRMFEMGVEPFLVASSVNIVIAQRLVRKVCPYCKVNYPPHAEKVEELMALEENPKFKEMMKRYFKGQELKDLKLYKGSGCKVCKHTGYLGRLGIFEVMEVDDDIKNLVTQKSSSAAIEAKAEMNGMTPMFYNGLVHVLSGLTTLDELLGMSNPE